MELLKRIRSWLGRHLVAFSSPHTNGKKAISEADDLLKSIRESRRQIQTTVSCISDDTKTLKGFVSDNESSNN